MELVEMDVRGLGGCRYVLHKISDKETKFSAHMLVKNNPLLKLMFNLMMKAKQIKGLQQSLENLQRYLKRQPLEELAV